ncbi:uncharacterized protein N7473_012293 [Penicillium subrubescens]|uniref:AA1-like domain-containing protein n=1 Tax=Penicillium subrubescens TaxID=1316194 RepID=A0A1Q5UDV4_9EURO|nr:uncharacterized protein N7473_012293 [Penicillium subrubescens]KAJ5881240.1 hypothetical protein N7473_012293 [Penicillium subrubescens]OKP10639.1 hypothetical protein PENSUB_3942 [Penicillium subrubescens]
MKVANLLSSIFTLSSIALASPVKRAESLHLRNFYVQHADDGTGALQFALHSTVTGLSDECFLSWSTTSDIQPSLATNKCLNNNYEFGFRYGIGNIENFVLVIQRVNETQRGYEVISAYATNPTWICTGNPVPGLTERCEWMGILDIDF